MRKFNLNLFFSLVLFVTFIRSVRKRERERIRRRKRESASKEVCKCIFFYCHCGPGHCVCVCLPSALVSPEGLETLNLPQLSGRGFRSFWLLLMLLLPHVTSLDCSRKSIDCRNVLIVAVVVCAPTKGQKFQLVKSGI